MIYSVISLQRQTRLGRCWQSTFILEISNDQTRRISLYEGAFYHVSSRGNERREMFRGSLGVISPLTLTLSPAGRGEDVGACCQAAIPFSKAKDSSSTGWQALGRGRGG
jgi:hypothetical protein